MNNLIIRVTILTLVLVCSGYAQNKAVVISEDAYLREEPERNGLVKATFEKGKELTVDTSRRKNGFFYASDKKKKGWVRGSKLDVRVKPPNRNSVWLFLGRTQRMHGFSVLLQLNVTQIVRNGIMVKYWTKSDPDASGPYLKWYMTHEPDRSPDQFEYSADLWEGNCSEGEIRSLRSLLYWRDGAVTSYEFLDKYHKVTEGSAGKELLAEACKVGKRS